MVFRIQPHTRLHEWVADEAGFFRDEGLEYEFDPDRYAAGSAMTGDVTTAGARPDPQRCIRGYGQGQEFGRFLRLPLGGECRGGRTPWAYVRQGLLRVPVGDLRARRLAIPAAGRVGGVEVAVGFHSGSHYSAIQGLEPFLERDQIALSFAGRPNDRLRGMLEGRIKAANVWGGQYYLLEQLGFRKLVDTPSSWGLA